MIVLPDQTWDVLAIEAIAAKMEEYKRHNWRIHSGKVFFKHRRAFYHLGAAQDAVRAMVNTMQLVRLAEGEDIVFSSYSGPLSEILFFHLDGFLEATRASYDAMLSFLISAEVLPHSSTTSMNDFTKIARKSPHRTTTDPIKITELLLQFWSDTGERAKNYRDCLTHYVTLSGPTWATSVMMVGRTSGWTPHMPWPDNPDSKTHAKFTFKKRLDAIIYCAEVYQEFDVLLRRLVSDCLVKWDAAPVEDEFTFTTTISLGME
jgi:hypothetical protein